MAGENKNLLKIRPSVKYNKFFDELRPIFDDTCSKCALLFLFQSVPFCFYFKVFAYLCVLIYFIVNILNIQQH